MRDHRNELDNDIPEMPDSKAERDDWPCGACGHPDCDDCAECFDNAELAFGGRNYDANP